MAGASPGRLCVISRFLSLGKACASYSKLSPNFLMQEVSCGVENMGLQPPEIQRCVRGWQVTHLLRSCFVICGIPVSAAGKVVMCFSMLFYAEMRHDFPNDPVPSSNSKLAVKENGGSLKGWHLTGPGQVAVRV